MVLAYVFIVLLFGVSLIHFKCFLHIGLINFQLCPLSADILTRNIRRRWPSPLNRLPLLHRQTPFLIQPTRRQSLDLSFYLIDDLIDLMILKEREVVGIWEGGERRDYCFALAHEVQQFEVVKFIVAPCGIELRFA